MKNLNISIILLIIISNIHLYSQERVFKPFKIDFGFTYDAPLDNNAGNGGGLYIEPRYGVNDNLIIGLRIDGLFLGSSKINMGLESLDVSTTTINPILITGDYYFSTDNARPFVGLGLGMYKRTIHSVDLSVMHGIFIGPTAETNFGFCPRVGLNVWHLRLAAIYNYTGKNISDFLGIQIGLEFGGGRINK